MIRPKALKPGDMIGLVAPASAVDEPEKVDAAVTKIESFGFRVKPGQSCRGRYGYLSGSDGVRAGDINTMFADPDVDGIICLRGGYGTPRILDRLDYEMIARNPKVFIGYSDITTIHIALNQKCGLVTFHGPMAAADMITDFDAFSSESLFNAVMGTTPLGQLANPPGFPIKTLLGGTAAGPVIGGNIMLAAATLGTPYEIDTTGKILLLEEIDEPPYGIDRMLTQLRLAGKLDACSGIILGNWNNCVPRKGSESLTLLQIFEDIITPCGKPTIYDVMAGHCQPKITVPLGMDAYLDADQGRLVIENSCVV